MAACAALAAGAVASAPASAAPGAQFGVQDDAWLLYGPDTLNERVTTLKQLGVGIVRVSVRWDEVAPTKPAHPRNPADPAYEWGAFDVALKRLRARGIPAVVTLWASPRWANGGHPPNWLPRKGFADFAYAASKRWPWVHLWTVWNEPDTSVFAHPVSPKLYTLDLLNPAYKALHQANRANLVAGGVTSPRRTPSGMSPFAFMEGMHSYHALLDAYAHHPYATSPGETPTHDPCRSCRTLTMAHLARLRADVTRLFGPKPIWLTEYGYQTNPPDRRTGVSRAAQALYLEEAALRVYEEDGVTMLINFLVRDDKTLAGWQSGLITAKNVDKPAFLAFQLPLVEMSLKDGEATVWGQVRPGHGRRPYALQQWNGKAWKTVGNLQRTDASGAFTRTVAARAGTKLRVSVPRLKLASAPLRLH